MQSRHWIEISRPQDGVGADDAGDLRLMQFCVGKARAPQRCVAKIGAAQPGAFEMSFLKIGKLEAGPVQIGAPEIGSPQVQRMVGVEWTWHSAEHRQGGLNGWEAGGEAGQVGERFVLAWLARLRRPRRVIADVRGEDLLNRAPIAPRVASDAFQRLNAAECDGPPIS